MNILLINHYAGSPDYGMEYRTYYFAKEWVKTGHKVTVLAASYSHLRIKNREMSDCEILEENIDGINYIWLKSSKYKGNGLARIFNMIGFAIKIYLLSNKIIDKCQPDVVLASTPHPFVIFGAKRIADKSNSRLVLEVRDLWPLTLIELGHIPSWHPLIKIMEWTEYYSYKKSEFVVSLLPKADIYMKERGMKSSKFLYIPNGIDKEEWINFTEIIPERHHEVLSELKSKNHFIVGYTGTHGIANALNYLLEAAKLVENYSHISFVLIGDGIEKESLKKQAIMSNLKNVYFLPSVQKKSIPKLLSYMDVLYIGWRKEKLYRFGVSPNKLMDYMMSQKPVIHSIEAGNDLVMECQCGISVLPEDSEAIANAILTLMGYSKEMLQLIGGKGRDFIIANHDYKVLAQNLLNKIQ